MQFKLWNKVLFSVRPMCTIRSYHYQCIIRRTITNVQYDVLLPIYNTMYHYQCTIRCTITNVQYDVLLPLYHYQCTIQCTITNVQYNVLLPMYNTMYYYLCAIQCTITYVRYHKIFQCTINIFFVYLLKKLWSSLFFKTISSELFKIFLNAHANQI